MRLNAVVVTPIAVGSLLVACGSDPDEGSHGDVSPEPSSQGCPLPEPDQSEPLPSEPPSNVEQPANFEAIVDEFTDELKDDPRWRGSGSGIDSEGWYVLAFVTDAADDLPREYRGVRIRYCETEGFYGY